MPRRKSKKPEQFQVEVITAARVTERRGWEYRVKWGGYNESENTWEPPANVKQCKRLLDSFWFHVGEHIRDRGNYVGYQVQAQGQWIAAEKAYFAQEVADEITKARNKPDEAVTEGESNPDDDPEPAAVIPPQKLTIKLPPAKRPSPTPPPSSSEEAPENDRQPPSSESLFSMREPSGTTKVPPPRRTSWKTKPKVKMLNIERNMTSQTSNIILSTKARITQDLTSAPTEILALPVSYGLPANTSLTKNVPTELSTGNDSDHNNDPPGIESASGIESEIPKEPSFSGWGNDFHLSQNFDVSGSESLFLKSPTPMSHTEPTESMNPAASDMFSITEDLARIQSIHEPEELYDYLPEIIMQQSSDDPIESATPTIESAAPTEHNLPSDTAQRLSGNWTGELSATIGHGAASKICEISLDESTQLTQCNSQLNYKFENLLASQTSLRIQEQVQFTDLDLLLENCSGMLQIGKVNPRRKSDEDPLKCLSNFMIKLKLAAVIPLTVSLREECRAALIFVFPSKYQGLQRCLARYPIDFHEGLTMAIFSFGPHSYRWQEASLKASNRNYSRKIAQAVRTLNFPTRLIQESRIRPQQSSYNYCLWFGLGSQDAKKDGSRWETNLLRHIMEYCKMFDVGQQGEPQVIFVHVGALKTLHILEGLAQKRKCMDIDFYTYGTDAGIPCKLWGIHEIYPRGGGIVTFTPDALIEDPVGVLDLIEKVAEHPMWQGYILPSALGISAKSLCEGADPLSELDAGHFLLQDILTAIEEGKASLMNAPAVPPSMNIDWMRAQLGISKLTSSGILERCLHAGSALYSNTPEEAFAKEVQNEITRDLLNIHVQHFFRNQFRRFVVIRAAAESAVSEINAFEWTTVDDFRFWDEPAEGTLESI